MKAIIISMIMIIAAGLGGFASKSIRISEILNDPRKYDGKEVRIAGTVTMRFPCTGLDISGSTTGRAGLRSVQLRSRPAGTAG